MIYVVYDTTQKHVVRAAYEIPKGMDYAEAERTIRSAYAQAAESPDNDQPSEILEELGFGDVEWMPLEIN